ncbi:MAG TPA: hypothetical protein VMU80_07990 [Bryobacteraceae bacterium]|nr:hypothetical protein [Bryobacteraceae bacterium]
MALTKVERERVSDSRMKIQSVARSLREVNPKRIPGFDEMETCLDDAEKNLTRALRQSAAESVTPESKGE